MEYQGGGRVTTDECGRGKVTGVCKAKDDFADDRAGTGDAENVIVALLTMGEGAVDIVCCGDVAKGPGTANNVGAGAWLLKRDACGLPNVVMRVEMGDGAVLWTLDEERVSGSTRPSQAGSPPSLSSRSRSLLCAAAYAGGRKTRSHSYRSR